MAKTAKPIQHSAGEEKGSRVHRPEARTEAEGMEQEKQYPETTEPASSLTWLQHQVGNRAVQRLLAQRSGEGPFELDDEIASRIDRERSGGQPLEEGTRDQVENALGQDFGGVRVHTSPEADTLNRQLGAEAFTTGQDIYFREGAYNPQSSAGQELLAHEITHVVQQASGQVSGGDRMTVNTPGDALEQQADAVAREVMSGTVAGLQRQEMPEEEEIQTRRATQRQELPEEEEVQTQRTTLQRDPLVEEEEETVQVQKLDEEEEIQPRRIDIQREAMPEEEEIQTQRLDEEEVASPGQTAQAPVPLAEAAPVQQAAPAMAPPAETAQAPAALPEAAPVQQATPPSSPAMALPATTAQAATPVSEAALAPGANAETATAPAPTPAGAGRPAYVGTEMEQIENAAAQQSEATRQEFEQLYKF